MFRLLVPLPKKITVALSGGVDSMAVVDFLSRNHQVSCVFFDHGTDNSRRAKEFLTNYTNDRGLELITGKINLDRPRDLSQEEHWRNQRYEFFDSLNCDIVTAHNLDDCVETYLHSSLHGRAKVIPTKRNRVLRPFLTTRKTVFVNWCRQKSVPWCEDLSNLNTKYTRNYIRHELLPHALRVNPGLYKTVKKIVEQQNIKYTVN